MEDPKILLRRFGNVFNTICFLMAVYMTVLLVTRFLENKDATSILYKNYGATLEDKYPTFSICFEGTNFHWYRDSEIFEAFQLTQSGYEQLLSGKTAYRYDYNHTSRLYRKTPIVLKEKINANVDTFHVQMSHFLLKSAFLTEDRKHAIYYGNDANFYQVPKPPFYIGYQTTRMICFTRQSNDPIGLIRLYDHLSLDRAIFNNLLYKQTKMRIFVHYHKQLMRYINNPSFSSTFSEYQGDKLLELGISQGTLLKKRPNSKYPCNPDIKDHDTYLQREISKKFGCFPPYWDKMNFEELRIEVCLSPPVLRKIDRFLQNNGNIWNLYDHPCLDMINSVTKSWEIADKDELGLIKIKGDIDTYNKHPILNEEYIWQLRYTNNKSNIRVIYNDRQYEEIQYARDFGFESFWSGVGGFAGLFMGFSIMQFPAILGEKDIS